MAYVLTSTRNYQTIDPKQEFKNPRKKLIVEKLLKFIDRGYLVICDAKTFLNCIDFFVPKGKTDIRMVFNGMSCGLSTATWASRFWLPMSGSMTRLLSNGYAVVNIDLGEIFINFPIHEQLHKFVGIDLSPVKHKLE